MKRPAQRCLTWTNAEPRADLLCSLSLADLTMNHREYPFHNSQDGARTNTPGSALHEFTAKPSVFGDLPLTSENTRVSQPVTDEFRAPSVKEYRSLWPHGFIQDVDFPERCILRRT